MELTPQDRAILRAIIDVYDEEDQTKAPVEAVMDRFGYTREQITAVGLRAEQLGLLEAQQTGQRVIRFRHIDDRARDLAKD